MTVDAETGLAAVEETAARAATATGIATIAAAILAGVSFGEFALVTATDWLPFDRFVVPVAAVVALSYGPIRSWFVGGIASAVGDVAPRALGDTETFDQVDSVGVDYRLLYYLFFGAVLHVVSLSAQGRATAVAATCGSTRRFLVPDCPLLSVTVTVTALDVTRALAWVSSGLLIVCAHLALLGWAVGRLTERDTVSSDRPLGFPWSTLVNALPSVVTASRRGSEPDHPDDDRATDGADDPADGSDGTASGTTTGSAARRRTVAFLRWGAVTAVVAATATTCLVVVLTRLARQPGVSWLLAHVFGFCLVAAVAATVGLGCRWVDCTRLREMAVTFGDRLVRRCRRSPAVGVAVSTVTIVVALASLWVAIDALPAHRRPVAELLVGNPFLSTQAGYWSTVHHFAVVGGLSAAVAIVADTRRLIRDSTLATVGDTIWQTVHTVIARARRLWYWLFDHNPDSASRWFSWVRIATLGQFFFCGLAINEAMFGDPFARLLAPVPVAAVIGGVAAWRDCRAHRDRIDRRAYARVCAVVVVPFFGGAWYLFAEYDESLARGEPV